MTTSNPDRARKTFPWRWFAAIAALSVAGLAGWVVFYAYPAHVEKARQWRPQMPAQELKALREKYQPKNLSFSSKACSRPEAPDSRLGVTSQTWNPDGSLSINASVAARCAISFPVGRYFTEGGRLRLEYLVYAGRSELPMCMCVYDLEYVITGLERRSYEIEVAASP
jgi:hypothetical protein